MITKDNIYASAGERDSRKTATDFRTGEVPNTVAMAEDVNTYGFWTDRDLWVVCKELNNLLSHFGISPNNSYSTGQQGQLATAIKSRLQTGITLTGINKADYTTAPTQNGNSISFSRMGINYNLGVYYGGTDAQKQKTTLSAQSLAATSSWANGVHFIYATTTPNSTTSTLGHQQTPVLAEDGATKCMLGSVFVINGAFQANSWKFQPWLEVSSVETREVPTAKTKGGFMTAKAGKQLKMGALSILDEGLNFGANPNRPDIMEIQTKDPFTYKFLYPGYNAGAADVSDIDSGHIYNMTSGTWDNLPASTSTSPKFVVMVPAITPAGQTVLIPPMSTKSGSTYNQVFASQREAREAIFGLQYNMQNLSNRLIYLGQSLIIRAGATNLKDPDQFLSVGVVPQALAGYTTAAGQSGGGAGAYIPMTKVDWTGYTNVNLRNTASNVIHGSTSVPITVSFPSPQTGIINQLEIEYFHTGSLKGITFPSNLKWWQSAPTFLDNTVYNIICEYINGNWIAGFLWRTN